MNVLLPVRWPILARLLPLLLAGLFLACPNARALTPGPSIVRQCPGCSNALHQVTIGSGNLFGAKFWSDGFTAAPMLPALPALVKCPHCRRPFWIEDARELGRIEFWDSGAKWKDLKVPLHPDEQDYLTAAGAPNLTRAREVYARQRAWWLANDPARADAGKAVTWTAPRRKNLERLYVLYHDQDDCERVWKAEILRELGQFDQCLLLLQRPVNGDQAEVADLLTRLAREKQPQVQRLPSRSR